MPTISLATAGNGNPVSRVGAWTPYMVEVEIDFATAATSKGSALAQGDVIEAISVPAASHVVVAGFEVLEAMTGTSTDATLDFGITSVNADEYVDGFDLDAASVGDYATPASTVYDSDWFATADTLDLLIATQTGTITGGKLRVYAYILPVAKMNTSAGIAAVGS